MSLSPGTRFGLYEVVALIGAGGMGEVYRARDTRLQRDVALKVLPETLAADHDRLARLEREAQMLAALNHPNIAAIHGLEEASGVRALALEFVDGPTLAELLSGRPEGRPLHESEEGGRGRPSGRPLPLDEALPIARQIAAALEAAHDAGIIHRDLKPANIKVRPDGTVKVLDFGLAKAVEARQGYSGTASMSPTLTTPAMTGIGTILGTAAYMAPEQARGRVLDKRADIWAFGCVLFEMLTGRRAFDGSDVTDVLASVIKSEPDWQALPAGIPPAVTTTLQRCLRKDPAQRFRDIGDVRLALDGAFHTHSVAAASAAPRARKWPTPLIAGASLLGGALLAGAAAWALLRAEPPRPVRLTAAHPRPDTVGGTNVDIAVTPDGLAIVYLAGDFGASRSQIFVRRLDQLTATRLAPGINSVSNIFLSPDGQWIGFVDVQERTLKKVALVGGSPVTIARLPPNVNVVGAVWAPDDRVVFGTTTTGLLEVAAGGGSPSPLTRPAPASGELAHRLPDLLPGGQILFTIYPGDNQPDSTRVAVFDRGAGTYRTLVQGGSDAQYVPSGHLVYASAGTLRAVAFDAERLQVRGNPVTLVEGVTTKQSSAASFSVSPAGTLAYIAGTAVSGRRTLAWIDRGGREEPVGVPTRAYAYVRVSPDGTRIAADIRDESNDIWTWDIGRRTLTRLTFDPGFNRGVVWTPDSRRLIFSAVRDGEESLYWQPADGSSPAERLTKGTPVQLPDAISPDGKWLLFSQPGTAPYDIGIVALDGGREQRMLLAEGYSETNTSISPDGRWVAYQSDESGRDEIYVRPFPNIRDGRWQISTTGGTRPLWSRDGRELFYFVAPGTLMAAPITPGVTFAAATPAPLLKGSFLAPQSGRMYDVSADGRRFLMLKEARGDAEAAAPPELIVVQNWLDELRRVVPVD